MPEERRIIVSMGDYSSALPPETNNVMHNSDPNFSSNFPGTEDDYSNRSSNFSGYESNCMSGEASPIMTSPWNQPSPFQPSPWISRGADGVNHDKSGLLEKSKLDGLVGSLVREEGHIYSLAATDDLLYTGSDSKNIRVWRNLKELTAFKSNSGLVKAIILSGDKIFTGHQDGKVRVWKKNQKDPSNHKRIGTFPTFFDILKSSMRPKNYVEVKRKCTTLWIKHCDAISSLSIDEEEGLLYSSSWDRTFKIWKISNSKCLESVKAHDDAVNSIVVSTKSGLVFTGSADGSVKVWKRERNGKKIKHNHVETLLNQECAVTALSLSEDASFVYCGLSDGLVNFWEWEKQLSHGGLLKGHKLAVLCLSTAGNLLFSGSADKTICVWKRSGNIHNCLSVLTGHTGPVKCLAVEREAGRSAADEKWVVYSGSLDKSVIVWKVSEKSQEMQHSTMMQSYVRY